MIHRPTIAMYMLCIILKYVQIKLHIIIVCNVENVKISGSFVVVEVQLA